MTQQSRIWLNSFVKRFRFMGVVWVSVYITSEYTYSQSFTLRIWIMSAAVMLWLVPLSWLPERSVFSLDWGVWTSLLFVLLNEVWSPRKLCLYSHTNKKTSCSKQNHRQNVEKQCGWQERRSISPSLFMYSLSLTEPDRKFSAFQLPGYKFAVL